MLGFIAVRQEEGSVAAFDIAHWPSHFNGVFFGSTGSDGDAVFAPQRHVEFGAVPAPSPQTADDQRADDQTQQQQRHQDAESHQERRRRRRLLGCIVALSLACHFAPVRIAAKELMSCYVNRCTLCSLLHRLSTKKERKNESNLFCRMDIIYIHFYIFFYYVGDD